jgi:hypothetical protein
MEPINIMAIWIASYYWTLFILNSFKLIETYEAQLMNWLITVCMLWVILINNL